MPFVAVGAHQMTSSISLVVEIELKGTLLEFSFLLSLFFLHYWLGLDWNYSYLHKTQWATAPSVYHDWLDKQGSSEALIVET